MNVPQEIIRGGNDPDLSWQFLDEDGDPIVPLPDLLELIIEPQSSPRIERDSRPGGTLVVDRVNAMVFAPMTPQESSGISLGVGSYWLWGTTDGRRSLWSGGTFTVRDGL